MDDICQKLDRIAVALEAIVSGVNELVKKSPDCSQQPERKITVHFDSIIPDRSDD